MLENILSRTSFTISSVKEMEDHNKSLFVFLNASSKLAPLSEKRLFVGKKKPTTQFLPPNSFTLEILQEMKVEKV